MLHGLYKMAALLEPRLAYECNAAPDPPRRNEVATIGGPCFEVHRCTGTMSPAKASWNPRSYRLAGTKTSNAASGVRGPEHLPSCLQKQRRAPDG